MQPVPKLAGFRDLRFLGAGSFGAVFEAVPEDKELFDRCRGRLALKFVIDPNYPYPPDPDDPESKPRTLFEGDSYVSQCKFAVGEADKEIDFFKLMEEKVDPILRRNVLNYYGVREYTKVDPAMKGLLIPGPVILLELCSRGSLGDFIKHRRDEVVPPALSYEEARDACCQLIGGLVAVHTAFLTHRDIAVRNVFVDERDGEIFFKLGDLGLAKKLKRADEKVSIPKERSLGLLGRGVEAKHLTQKSDVFMMGVVLAQLLCMELFEYDSIEELHANLQDERRVSSTLRNYGGVAEILLKMTADHNKRWTADKIQEHFQNLPGKQPLAFAFALFMIMCRTPLGFSG